MEDLKTIIEELAKLTAKVDEMIKSINQKIAAVEAILHEHEKHVENLEKRLEALEEAINEIKAEETAEDEVSEEPVVETASPDPFSLFEKMGRITEPAAPVSETASFDNFFATKEDAIGSNYKKPITSNVNLEQQLEQMQSSGIGKRLNSVDMSSMQSFNNFFNKSNTNNFNKYNHYETPKPPVFHKVTNENNNGSWENYSNNENDIFNNVPSATNPRSKKYKFTLAGDESYFSITENPTNNTVRIYKGSIGFDVMFKRLKAEGIHTYDLSDKDVNEYRAYLNKFINKGIDPTIPQSQPSRPTTNVTGTQYELKPFINNDPINAGMYY